MELLTDNAIMLSVKKGDLDRMGLLFERHHHALYGFLFHMTNDRETSEDIVQNVFFRMMKYRHTYTGKGEFITWMYHITRNLLKDHYKKNKKKPQLVEIYKWEERTEGGVPADERIEKRQELHVLYHTLMQLHEEYREVLILSRFQELKYEEIAQVLGITEGAVKVKVHRAMNQLKTIYLKTEKSGTSR